ncbi:MAG TPA: phosphodiester glycosidase family protein [Rhizomicrobium sp.]|nr:phosphodiester glycosidase family protein [Rhizomicrobium sp.]
MKLAALIIAIVAALGATMQSGRAQPVCVRTIFETSGFTVCPVDTRREDIRIASTDASGAPLRTFDNLAKALGPDAARVRFAMNAGMFDDQGAPIGLYVEDGAVRVALNTQSGTGNFYLKPNGVFWIDRNGTLGIDTAADYGLHPHAPQWATQSGPMLVIDDQINPQIAPDGPSKFIRNGVCIRGAHTAVFAISEEPVSFGRMARFFRDGRGCRNALYFDGVVSSLWAPSLARKDNTHPLGPMIVVMDR